MLLNQIKARVVENFISINKNIQIKSRRSLIHFVKWQSPKNDYYVLNTNGSSVKNPSPIRASGIIRNYSSSWVSSFYKGLGSTINNVAELWVVF